MSAESTPGFGRGDLAAESAERARVRARVQLITDPAYTPPDTERHNRCLSHLRVALRSASIAARDFATSDEPIDIAQRERYMSLAETLEAQERSLRAEV